MSTPSHWDGGRGSAPDAEDLQHLATSWITPELAAQAGIRRVESFDGAQSVGRSDEKAGRGKYSGLIFPNIWPNGGSREIRGERLRLDRPEYRSGKDGVPKVSRRYLAAPGSRNLLYVTPGTPPAWLEDTTLPVAISEGEKKALSLHRLALHESEEPRFLPIATTGVWNYKGKIGKTEGPKAGEHVDVHGVVPDFDRIAWDDRIVYVCYDVDVNTNDSVKYARRGLAAELARRGAQVKFVNIPEESGVKGIDDLLAAWGAERVLPLFETAGIANQPAREVSTQYRVKNGGLSDTKAAAAVTRSRKFRWRISTRQSLPTFSRMMAWKPNHFLRFKLN